MWRAWFLITTPRERFPWRLPYSHKKLASPDSLNDAIRLQNVLIIPPKFTQITFTVKLYILIQYYTAVLNLTQIIYRTGIIELHHWYQLFGTVAMPSPSLAKVFLAWTRFYYSLWCSLSLDIIDHDGAILQMTQKRLCWANSHMINIILVLR